MNGSSTITATIEVDGRYYSATCLVDVTVIPITLEVLSDSTIYTQLGEKITVNIKVNNKPPEKDVQWLFTGADAEGCDVIYGGDIRNNQYGEFWVDRIGTARIIPTINTVVQKKVDVVVREPELISINKVKGDTGIISVGEKRDFEFSLEDNYADYCEIVWEITKNGNLIDSQTLSSNSNYSVTITGGGTYTVTAKAKFEELDPIKDSNGNIIQTSMSFSVGD